MDTIVGSAAYQSSAIKSAIASAKPIQAHYRGEEQTQNNMQPFTLWLQYDHLLPHARSGTNDLENVVITCAPCNYGRGGYTLEEVGLADPRLREPVRSTWDGLERFS